MKQQQILLLLITSVFFTTINAQVFIKDSINYVATEKLIVPANALHFIAMGDWGRNGADHQKQVAAQMGKTASEIKSQFVIATG
ncbi:MAG: hypothetical protein ACQUYJ_18610, partial [Ferruginibacter sp.]